MFDKLKKKVRITKPPIGTHAPLKPNRIEQHFRRDDHCCCGQMGKPYCPATGPNRKCFASFMPDKQGGILHPRDGRHSHVYCVQCKKTITLCKVPRYVVGIPETQLIPATSIIEVDKCKGCEGANGEKFLWWRDKYNKEWVDLDDW